VASTSNVSQNGSSSGIDATVASIHHTAISTPSAPPMSASTTLSASICRTRRQRPAPSAMRTAISRWRAVARASSRLATFAQAMSSTKPHRAEHEVEHVPQRPLDVVVAVAHHLRDPARVGGRVLRGEPARDRVELALRVSTVAPGASRPTAWRYRSLRDSNAAGGTSGTHTWPGLRELEARRHHAHHGVRRAVEQQLGAHRRRLRAEAPLPQLVAHDDDALAPLARLLGEEPASERGAHAEHAEQVRAHRPSSSRSASTAPAPAPPGEREAPLVEQPHVPQRRRAPRASRPGPRG
jgi:hypothetical protein